MSSKELKNRRRSDYPFYQEYRTRWSDNDMYDHMNNNIYGLLFDSIINSFLISHCNLSPPTSPQFGLVVSSYCNFFGSIAFPCVAELGMRVNKLGKTSVTYEVGVFEEGKEDVRAVGGFTHVFVDREGGRPAAAGIPAEARRSLETLMVEGKDKGKAKL